MIGDQWDTLLAVAALASAATGLGLQFVDTRAALTAYAVAFLIQTGRLLRAGR